MLCYFLLHPFVTGAASRPSVLLLDFCVENRTLTHPCANLPQKVHKYVVQEYIRACLVSYESLPRNVFHEGWGRPGEFIVSCLCFGYRLFGSAPLSWVSCILCHGSVNAVFTSTTAIFPHEPRMHLKLLGMLSGLLSFCACEYAAGGSVYCTRLFHTMRW